MFAQKSNNKNIFADYRNIFLWSSWYTWHCDFRSSIFDSASWLYAMPVQYFLKILLNSKRLDKYRSPDPPTLPMGRENAPSISLKNMALFGLGVPYFLLSCVGIVFIFSVKRKKSSLQLYRFCWLLLYQDSRILWQCDISIPCILLLAFFAAWMMTHAIEGLSKKRRYMVLPLYAG